MVWLAVSCCIAALFGALHNQVSFTLSDEYFTKFKFFQFGLSEFDVAPRILAAYVGILALLSMISLSQTMMAIMFHRPS